MSCPWSPGGAGKRGQHCCGVRVAVGIGRSGFRNGNNSWVPPEQHSKTGETEQVKSYAYCWCLWRLLWVWMASQVMVLLVAGDS